MAEAKKPAQFVHLRVKSAYSLLEGAIRPKELAELARANAMPAVGITDVNNLFGVYEISDALAKAGVQPIVGCLLSVDLDEAAAPGAMVCGPVPATTGPKIVPDPEGAPLPSAAVPAESTPPLSVTWFGPVAEPLLPPFAATSIPALSVVGPV